MRKLKKTGIALALCFYLAGASFFVVVAAAAQGENQNAANKPPSVQETPTAKKKIATAKENTLAAANKETAPAKASTPAPKTAPAANKQAAAPAKEKQPSAPVTQTAPAKASTPAAKTSPKAPEKKAKTKADKKNNKKNKGTQAAAPPAPVYFNGAPMPHDYRQISIFGQPVATQAQAVAYIKKHGKNVRLACSVEKLVEYYWQEAERENVRADIALCQAILETGFFSFGGDVSYKQNNFCGLGTVGGGKKGAAFKTPQIGVRAHIQHLLAYSRKKLPTFAIVDPRYTLAHNLRLDRGLIDNWYGLNGTWAMGKNYCEKIMVNYQALLSQRP